MCTVSWLHRDDGYHLLSNRDEKRTRSLALPPTVHAQGGLRIVAPTDRDFGGTWIGVNERGVSVCIVNGPPTPRDHQVSLSRGLIVQGLLDSASIDEVLERLTSAELGDVAPFQIVAIQPETPALVFNWDGSTRTADVNADTLMPLISSSFDPEGVEVERRECFQGGGIADVHALERIHASHGVQPDAYSVCMHRPDAHTVSFSRVSVTPTAVQFAYTPTAPCKSVPPIILSIPRQR